LKSTVVWRQSALVATVLTALVASILSGCSSPSNAGGNVADVVRAVSAFQGEDWLCPACDVGSSQLIDPVFESLLARDNETGGVKEGEGVLVEKWETITPARKWSFTLRSDIPFHGDNGTVSADDVVFSWKLAAREDSKNPAASLFAMGKITKTDKMSFTIELPMPYLAFLQQLTEMPNSFPITSKSYVEKVGEDAARKHPVGTGPFEFVSHSPGVDLEFKAVKDHWRKAPEIDTLTVKVVPQANIAIEMAKAGEVQITDVADPNLLEGATGNGLKQFTIPGASLATVYLLGQYEKATYPESDRPAWADKDQEKAKLVRQGLSHAINREAIVDSLLKGIATTDGACVTGFFPAMPGYDDSCEPDAYDTDEAKALLAKAGYTDPSDLTVLVDLALRPGRPWNSDVMQAVVQDWQAIGVTVKTQKSEFTRIEEESVGRKANYAMLYPTPVWPIAHEILGFFSRTTDRLSYTGESTELDRLLNAADAATTPEEGEALDSEIFTYLREQEPAIPIAYVDAAFLMNAGLDWSIPETVAYQYPYRFEYLKPTG
jgi:peptide/nickel transport system substrate-binding protein